MIADSTIFITTAAWLVGDARPWGWLTSRAEAVKQAREQGLLSDAPHG